MEVLALAPGWKVPILLIYIIWMNGGARPCPWREGPNSPNIHYMDEWRWNRGKLNFTQTYPKEDISIPGCVLGDTGWFIHKILSIKFCQKTKHTYCESARFMTGLLGHVAH